MPAMAHPAQLSHSSVVSLVRRVTRPSEVSGAAWDGRLAVAELASTGSRLYVIIGGHRMPVSPVEYGGGWGHKCVIFDPTLWWAVSARTRDAPRSPFGDGGECMCGPSSFRHNLGYTMAQPSPSSDASPCPGTVPKFRMAHFD